MQRSVLLRLNDILRAIDGATETIAGADFETFRSVYHMGRTLERCIEIVSEATRHLPAEIKSGYPDIPSHGTKLLESETYSGMTTILWTTT
jgi:uncharacterized protein with HEPN domain